MISKCKDGNVNGLTKGCIYFITDIFIRNEGITVGILKDDYGIYGEFNINRFILIEGTTSTLKNKTSIYDNELYHQKMTDENGNCLACSSTKDENESLWTDCATSFAIISGNTLVVGDYESKEQNIEIAIKSCPLCGRLL